MTCRASPPARLGSASGGQSAPQRPLAGIIGRAFLRRECTPSSAARRTSPPPPSTPAAALGTPGAPGQFPADLHTLLLLPGARRGRRARGGRSARRGRRGRGREVGVRASSPTASSARCGFSSASSPVLDGLALPRAQLSSHLPPLLRAGGEGRRGQFSGEARASVPGTRRPSVLNWGLGVKAAGVSVFGVQLHGPRALGASGQAPSGCASCPATCGSWRRG